MKKKTKTQKKSAKKRAVCVLDDPNASIVDKLQYLCDKANAPVRGQAMREYLKGSTHRAVLENAELLTKLEQCVGPMTFSENKTDGVLHPEDLFSNPYEFRKLIDDNLLTRKMEIQYDGVCVSDEIETGYDEEVFFSYHSEPSFDELKKMDIYELMEALPDNYCENTYLYQKHTEDNLFRKRFLLALTGFFKEMARYAKKIGSDRAARLWLEAMARVTEWTMKLTSFHILHDYCIPKEECALLRESVYAAARETWIQDQFNSL